MTNTVDALTFRPATPGDQLLLDEWATTEPVAWVDRSRLHDELTTRNYRHEWTWVAERSGEPVARALWWGSSSAERPVTLDCLLVAATEEHPDNVGAGLIRAALTSFGGNAGLEFNVDVAADWRTNTAAVRATAWRQRAAHEGGLTRTTERVSFARTSTDALPMRPQRLRFTGGTDNELRELFAAVAAGSLDAHTIDAVAKHGLDSFADDELAFYLSLPGRRESWQIAALADGTTVGFIIPTRTAYDASISYLGVLPEYRGHGHVHELLSQMVHVHHDDGQDRIVGTTDAANFPMRAAFEGAGFKVTRVRMVHAD